MEATRVSRMATGVAAGALLAGCASCMRTIDPWAYAYSTPMLTLQLLIVPAGIVPLLALLPRPSR